MILDIARAVVLGAVEGVTEFLPVSSTGHLILVNQWVAFSPDFTKLFDVFIQLGAILAVVVYFWQKIWPFGQGAAHRQATLALWLKVLVAVVPAIILGALFGTKIEDKLFTPLVVATALIIGGIVLVLVERQPKRASFSSLTDLSIVSALYIGLAQCLALIPGTSRSAATIIAALLLGASRVVAAEFSFFLAVPTMVAASGYSLLKHGLHISGAEAVLLVVGFVVAFLTALAVVRLFMDFIQRRSFTAFGWYRIGLGLLVLALLYW